MITLWIPILPLTANTMKVWCKGHFIPNAKYQKRKKAIQNIIFSQWTRRAFSDSVKVSIVFRLKNPMKKWDLDNHVKAVNDAINGICFLDDSQIVVLQTEKIKIPKNEPEGFELSIEPVPLREKETVTKTKKQFIQGIMSLEEFKRLYR